MALRPNASALLVTPTGDNDESERPSGLIVVDNENPAKKIYRGVVQAVGKDIQDDIDRGDTAFYWQFSEFGEYHLVYGKHLMAWEDDE